MTPAMNSTRRLSARAVALIGTGAVVAYALLAAVQILVWNPQAAVPGVGLDQIYADVAATGESMAAGMVIAFLAVGPLLAIALLVGAWRRPEGSFLHILPINDRSPGDNVSGKAISCVSCIFRRSIELWLSKAGRPTLR